MFKLSIRNDFIIGALVIFPIAGFLWLIDASVAVITGPVSQLTGIRLSGGGGLLISLLIIWGFGWLVRIFVGRSIFLKLESIIIKLPIIRTLYQSIRQIAGLILHKQQRFLATVYIEYPSKGIFSLGFLTNNQIKPMQTEAGQPLIKNPVAVFIPSTPNPTNGIFVYVDQSSVYPSQMSIEDGIKSIVSAGMISPKGSV